MRHYFNHLSDAYFTISFNGKSSVNILHLLLSVKKVTYLQMFYINTT